MRLVREVSLGHNDLRFTSCNRDPLPVLFPAKERQYISFLKISFLDLLISTSQSWWRASVVETMTKKQMHMFEKGALLTILDIIDDSAHWVITVKS